MNDYFLSVTAAGTALSLICYGIGVCINKKWKLSVLNPLLIAITAVIIFLKLFGVSYDSYFNGAKYLSYFLTPATVSLAIPLYRKIDLLKTNGPAILIGIFSGVIAGLASVWLLSFAFHLSHQEYVTLLPKSITTAIGIGVAEELGGYTVITAAVIIITGVFGNIVAETLCRWFGIKHEISRGIAIGTAAHAIGTAKAMEMGETEGAMSSLAIVISGLYTVVGAAVFSLFF